ncbi:MAG: GGDEF domain-containing protein [Rhodocyclaceae bacterium]|nr:GGDEF domain-containing protein [Rhodocyclaceae bacterium]
MNPSETARETLKRLSLQRIPPTPDNYRALYNEIAGTAITEDFPEKSLKALASGLPRNTPEQLRFARQVESAVSDKNWESLNTALTDLLNKSAAEPPNWSALIRDLLTRLEARQADLTPARKREALDHVLAASPAPDLLYSRLQGLLKTWSQSAGQESSMVAAPADAAEASAVSGTAAGAAGAVPPAPTFTQGTPRPADLAKGATGELLDLLAQILESAISTVLADNVELVAEATRLATAARAARNADDIAAFIANLKRFSYRLNFAVEDQAELKSGLLHLLHLIIDNINELVLDDQSLQGQIAVVLELVSQPLNLRRLDDVERRMKDVIYKQSALKKSLLDARDQIKQMLASFIDRLADLSESTGDYHDKIERCADQISKAHDIADLSAVLEEVMRETRLIQLNAQRSRDELMQMRGKVGAAEREIERLQDELANASQMVRHDPLTGVLNRKGMDDALDTEVGRARRHHGKLCLALLDIDNFKKLNDTLGHAAGDAALVHLAKVVHEAIRPEDTLARYGGEEFVVILPDTALESAVGAMVRVQRELTKHFFLHNNDRVLITFSCGVAELGADEEAMAAIQRADGAMYLAKRAGKNRVLAA